MRVSSSSASQSARPCGLVGTQVPPFSKICNILPTSSSVPCLAVRVGEQGMRRQLISQVSLLEHRLRDEFGSLAVPEWSVEWAGEQARATARIHLYGVEHSFQGALKEDKVAAITDTARRVLWYLQNAWP